MAPPPSRTDGDLSPLLATLATALGADPGPEARGRLVRWLDEARRWNEKLDLTAARTHAALVEVLAADALVAADPALVPTGSRLLDAGTGAGTPGLALAILRPDVSAILAEPLQKRAAFLRTVVGTLGLASRVRVVSDRIDPDAPRAPESADLFVSRATFAPEIAARVGLALAPEALLFLVDALPPLPAGASVVATRRYQLPSSGAPRLLARIRRGEGEIA